MSWSRRSATPWQGRPCSSCQYSLACWMPVSGHKQNPGLSSSSGDQRGLNPGWIRVVFLAVGWARRSEVTRDTAVGIIPRREPSMLQSRAVKKNHCQQYRRGRCCGFRDYHGWGVGWRLVLQMSAGGSIRPLLRLMRVRKKVNPQNSEKTCTTCPPTLMCGLALVVGKLHCRRQISLPGVTDRHGCQAHNRAVTRGLLITGMRVRLWIASKLPK